jgi:hypothetical protein
MDQKEIYLRVREIVNEADPLCILAFGGIEEYSPEIKDIIKKLENCTYETDMLLMTIDVFENWFNMSGPIEAHLYMAKKLCLLKSEIEQSKK